MKKNLVYNISYQILILLLPLVTAPYITRILGADALGLYVKSNAIAYYFYLFTILGLNNYGNRAIARVRDDSETLSKTFWEIYSVQFISSLIAVTAFCFFAILWSGAGKTILFIQIVYVLSGAFEINWLCFGLEEFRLCTVRSAVIRLMSVIAIFTFVKNNGHLIRYTWIMTLSFLLSAIAVWPFVLKRVTFIRPSIRGMLAHVRPNLILFWPVVAISLYNVMDILMLGIFDTDREVAFYNYAERIVTIPITVLLAMSNAIMPRMSHIYAQKKENDAKHIMDMMMQVTIILCSLTTFGIASISERFSSWFFGDEFLRCGYFILLLSPTVFVKGCAAVLRTQYIIPSGKDSIYVISITAGAVMNLLLNFFFIPRLGGVGAVIGTIVAEFVVCILQFWFCKKNVPILCWLKDIFVNIIIGITMFCILRILPLKAFGNFFSMLIMMIVGSIFYACFVLLYQCLIKRTDDLSLCIRNFFRNLKLHTKR